MGKKIDQHAQARKTKARRGSRKLRMTRKRKRRQKVVAFSRCSCAQRVAGRLAGIELDGSSPGNRIFCLSLAHHLPPFALVLTLFISLSLSLSFSLSLFTSLCHSVPYRCSSRVCSNLLARPTFLSPLFLYRRVKLSPSVPLNSRSSSNTPHHTTYTPVTLMLSLVLSRSPDSPPPAYSGTCRGFSLLYIPWPMTLGRPRTDLHRRALKIRYSIEIKI